jgi:hypothetical protein
MIRYTSALLAFGALALGVTLTTSVDGSETSLNTHHFTFSRTVALPGTELPAGTYIFERLAVTEPDIVVVRSRDRSKVHYMGLTDRVDRSPDVRLDQPAVILGEARRGTAIPITSWYATGSVRGHRFVYPR